MVDTDWFTLHIHASHVPWVIKRVLGVGIIRFENA